MLWGICNAVLGLVNTFFYKKATDLCVQSGFSTSFRTLVMSGITTPLIMLVAMIFPGFFGIFDAWNILDTKGVLLILGMNAFSIVGSLTSQYAYANEKISVLAPFEQVSGMMTIIFGFLFLSGNSVVAFVFALIASLVIFLGAIDFKSFTINRYSGTLLIGEFFFAASGLAVASLVVQYSSFVIILSKEIIGTIFAAMIVIFAKSFIPPTREHIRGPYFWFFANNLVWYATYAIGLYLIRDLGIVFASLLGMISLLGSVGISWYMGDRPSKKEWIVAGVVSACILFAGIYS